MTTLFSPVGTADPITMLGDGPMLHIIRHYRPDRVVLFLSPKMSRYQEVDGRYTNAIERLCTAEGWERPVVELVESPFEKVYRFDHYIEEFEQILQRLYDNDPGEPILVNVSSGTPGMSQALVALGSFARLPLRLLQVKTPKRDANGRFDREDPDHYDLDAMWSWYEEQCEGDQDALVSRITEVETPNFAGRLLRENIVELINSYEYKAAYELASGTMSISQLAKQMIAAARDRLNLVGALPAKVFAKTPIAYRPNDLLGEFLSVMEVRLDQGNWADFARLLTPAFTHLAVIYLRRNGLYEQEYLRIERGKATNILDWNSIDHNPKLRMILDYGTRRPRYVTNSILSQLIQEYCIDAREREMFGQLRHFESECRNPLSHDLIASSKESLERIGGLSLEDVMNYLFELHGNARRGLYKDINRAIIERL